MISGKKIRQVLSTRITCRHPQWSFYGIWKMTSVPDRVSNSTKDYIQTHALNPISSRIAPLFAYATSGPGPPVLTYKPHRREGVKWEVWGFRRSARGEKRLFGQKVTSWQWANPKIQKASTATHLLGEKDTLELKRQRAKPSKGILPIKWPKEKGRNYGGTYPNFH